MITKRKKSNLSSPAPSKADEPNCPEDENPLLSIVFLLLFHGDQFSLSGLTVRHLNMHSLVSFHNVY